MQQKNISEGIDNTMIMKDVSTAVYNGDILRKIRIRKGIDINLISYFTKISKHILQFIEEDNYSLLPHPVYLKEFIKQYSKLLGLDPKKVATSYMERYLVHKK